MVAGGNRSFLCCASFSCRLDCWQFSGGFAVRLFVLDCMVLPFSGGLVVGSHFLDCRFRCCLWFAVVCCELQEPNVRESGFG